MTGPPERITSARSAPGTATWLAERALLGALLRRPERIADMRTWLKADDFGDPRHSAVFAAIANLHAANELHPIASEDDATLIPDGSGTSALNGPTMQSIAQNTLRVERAYQADRSAAESVASSRDLMTDLFFAGAGTRAEQYVRYGQMVLEMSVRRQVDAWGIRLERAAAPTTVIDGSNVDPLPVRETNEAMVANLADLAGRVRRATGGHHLPTQQDKTIVPEVVSATPPTARLVERAEKLVIHAVLAVPRWRSSGLVQRLRPEDFLASKAHQNTWRAIQTVAARGELVDPITVAWETEAVGDDNQLGIGPDDRAMLTPSELARMSAEPSGDVARAISTVARSALAHHAKQAQLNIQKVAANRRNDLSATLDAARSVGADLDKKALRLTGAKQPERKSLLARALDGERAPTTASAAVETPARTR